MKFVYVRHAEKEYPNMGAEIYKHDPGITKKGAEKAREVAENLIRKYGEPSEIRISPFRRCRETGLEMASVLKSYKELVVDKDLSEFLGNHKDTDLDVTISTKIHNPPHPESFEDMKNRVYRHVQKTRKIMTKKTGVIWFVTHGLIIKQIANIFGLTITKSPRYLNSMCIFEDKDTLYAEMIMFKDGDMESKIYVEDEESKSKSKEIKKKKRSYEIEGKNIKGISEGNINEKERKSHESGERNINEKERKSHESGERKNTEKKDPEKKKSYETVERRKSRESAKKDWKRRDYYNNRNWSEDNLPQDMLRKNPIKILSKSNQKY